jgi:hypothetical protein
MFAVAQAGLVALAISAVVAARPNFVFVLTDDQDAHMRSIELMPEVQEHLVAKGATFENHFCTGKHWLLPSLLFQQDTN